MRAIADLLRPAETPAPDEGPWQPPVACETCRDKGFVLDEAAWERQGYRGGLLPCPRCGESRRRQRLERISGLSPAMQGWRLSNFRGRRGCEEALEAAAAAVARPRGFLTFWGPWGTGKTRLLASIANECRDRGMAAVYTTMADLLDDLRATFDPQTPESFGHRWDLVLSARVLAIDEIEKIRPTRWSLERLFSLVDNRYRHAAERLTVVATNSRVGRGCQLLPGVEPQWEGYLESRLLDGRFTVVELRGGDARPASRWADAGTMER